MGEPEKIVSTTKRGTSHHHQQEASEVNLPINTPGGKENQNERKTEKHTITTCNQPLLHRRTELNTKLDLPTMALPLIDLGLGLPDERAGWCLCFVGHIARPGLDICGVLARLCRCNPRVTRVR